jgi:hypothetical protein
MAIGGHQSVTLHGAIIGRYCDPKNAATLPPVWVVRTYLRRVLLPV